MNHRRKRRRRSPRCAMCTPNRHGNSKNYNQGTHAKVTWKAYKQTGT